MMIPGVFQDSYYRSDSGGFLKAGKKHIFIVSAEGGKPIQLTKQDYPHNGSISWSSDSTEIYYSSNYRGNWQIDRTESEIYAVTVATSQVRQVTDRDGFDASPSVSPDGKYLIYRGADDVSIYQDAKLHITSTEKHEPRGVPRCRNQSSSTKDSRSMAWNLPWSGFPIQRIPSPVDQAAC